MTHTETRIDALERRCPRLGGPVRFSYCCAAENKMPCFKVLDCWWEYFDVITYFKQRLSPEAFARLKTTRPPEKTTSLLDLIRQAQKRTGQSS